MKVQILRDELSKNLKNITKKMSTIDRYALPKNFFKNHYNHMFFNRSSSIIYSLIMVLNIVHKKKGGEMKRKEREMLCITQPKGCLKKTEFLKSNI